MLYIRTKHGDAYHVTAQGYIIRLDQPGFKPSGEWIMLGIDHVKRRSFVPLAQLMEHGAEGLTMRYKNGNPQWTVRDRDHGTTRVWGNTVYHGIVDIRVIADTGTEAGVR